MIKLALGLIHNKATALANRQQIQNLLPLVVSNTDANGRPFYTLSGVLTEHEVMFYQAIPFGVAHPNNLYSLDSHKVFYGAGDENKTGEHPRFFNWLFKRATDYGAEVVCFVRFPTLFASADIDVALARITTTRLLLVRTWGFMVSVRLLRALRAMGEETLDEGQAFDNAIDNLKTRMQARGMEWE